MVDHNEGVSSENQQGATPREPALGPGQGGESPTVVDHRRLSGVHKYVFPSGAIYDGNWVDGRKHGVGYQVYDNNSGTYHGEFRSDKRHGKGKFTYPDGDEYEGEFVAGKREGFGKYTYHSGGYYEGEWLAERMHGSGKSVDTRNRILVIQWRDGKPHGEGLLTDGAVKYRITYEDGKMVSYGVDKSQPGSPASSPAGAAPGSGGRAASLRKPVMHVRPTEPIESRPTDMLSSLLGCFANDGSRSRLNCCDPEASKRRYEDP